VSVLAVLEHAGDTWRPHSLEALTAAQQMGADLGVPVSAAAFTPKAAQLAGSFLDAVYEICHPVLAEYTADGYSAALEALILKLNPRLVVFPHTYQTRDYAPKLATRLGSILLSDVIRHRVENGGLILTRPLFQGKLHGDYRLSGSSVAFVSIQAGAYRSGEIPPGHARAETFVPEIPSTAIRVRPEPPFRETAEGVDLSKAERIIAVGRGIQNREGLSLVEELAHVIGAEVGASRPVCDYGWLPMERQIGSSGQTVAPALYMALGISGAIQHLVGMKGSKIIVAVNKDPEAPIFEVADYGIVGDLFEIVPEILEELRKADK